MKIHEKHQSLCTDCKQVISPNTVHVTMYGLAGCIIIKNTKNIQEHHKRLTT